jgi:hypothetical protein
MGSGDLHGDTDNPAPRPCLPSSPSLPPSSLTFFRLRPSFLIPHLHPHSRERMNTPTSHCRMCMCIARACALSHCPLRPTISPTTALSTLVHRPVIRARRAVIRACESHRLAAVCAVARLSPRRTVSSTPTWLPEHALAKPAHTRQ